MRYLLLIYAEESDAPPPDEVAAASHAAYAAFSADVKARGRFLAGEALTSTSTATTVRSVNGETVTTDGPFAETKEALGGFYLIEARDLDEAIEIAAKIPAAKEGSIEVRPIWELPAEYAMAEAEAAAAAAGGPG
ncbi:MAG TPA: YciI family protein [Candidatus Limnocylindrales bacterium]|nr:YciI family protein [Candidatus Limnocylindrales bacterium]